MANYMPISIFIEASDIDEIPTIIDDHNMRTRKVVILPRVVSIDDNK